MKNKAHYLVYKTTNLITGRFYIGSHQTNKIDDGYLGSGKILRYSIKKRGKENFKREIIAYCVDAKVMRSIETQLVNYSILNFRRECYNRSFSGTGAMLGADNSFYGKKHTEETRKKLSASASKRIGEKNPFFGKKHTKETIEHLKSLPAPTIDTCKKMLDGYKNRQKHWWCTPTGCYYSSHEAFRNTPDVAIATLKARCKLCDKVNPKNYQIPKYAWGKTWRELGWYIISVDEVNQYGSCDSIST